VTAGDPVLPLPLFIKDTIVTQSICQVPSLEFIEKRHEQLVTSLITEVADSQMALPTQVSNGNFSLLAYNRKLRRILRDQKILSRIFYINPNEFLVF